MILAYLDWQDEVAPIFRQLRLHKRQAVESEQEAIDRQPDLEAPELAIGIKAWRASSSCRHIGFGIGPIPQTAIDAWCDRFGLDLLAADILSDAIRFVDNVVLERQAAAARSKGGK